MNQTQVNKFWEEIGEGRRWIPEGMVMMSSRDMQKIAIKFGKGEPCQKGETATRSGCIPAEGGEGGPSQPAAQSQSRIAKEIKDLEDTRDQLKSQGKDVRKIEQRIKDVKSTQQKPQKETKDEEDFELNIEFVEASGEFTTGEKTPAEQKELVKPIMDAGKQIERNMKKVLAENPSKENIREVLSQYQKIKPSMERLHGRNSLPIVNDFINEVSEALDEPNFDVLEVLDAIREFNDVISLEV